MSNLGQLQKKLMNNCTTKSGFFDPTAAFDALNEIQKAEDPKAYEPEL